MNVQPSKSFHVYGILNTMWRLFCQILYPHYIQPYGMLLYLNLIHIAGLRLQILLYSLAFIIHLEHLVWRVFRSRNGYWWTWTFLSSIFQCVTKVSTRLGYQLMRCVEFLCNFNGMVRIVMYVQLLQCSFMNCTSDIATNSAYVGMPLYEYTFSCFI